MIFSGIISAVGGVATAWRNKKVEETKAKGELKVAVEKRKTKMATGEIDWDQTMAEASKDSWKDEWLVLLFSVPLILAFCGDWGRAIVESGFAALETAPEWYRYTLGVIVAASFGFRGAAKFFKK